MSYNYTKSEIDDMVSSLGNRITNAAGILETVNTAISTHNTASDAHNNILSLKANTSDITTLSASIDSLNNRVQQLETTSGSRGGLEGTLNYLLTGTKNETAVNIQFDIQPVDENNPVTYEVYGNESTLLTGLSFNTSTGVISGTPTVAGTATFTVLAKSSNQGVFIEVNQNFEEPYVSPVGIEEAIVTVGEAIPPDTYYELINERYVFTTDTTFQDGKTYYWINPGTPEPEDEPVSQGVTEMNNIISKLRAGNLSGITEGTQYTIKIADETADTSRKITYNSLQYVRKPAEDTNNLFAWANGSSRIYTDEIAMFEGASIKDSSGNTIGTLPSTPTYMKDYKIMVTSIDTDTPTDGSYPHTVRFEFLNTVCDSKVFDADNSNTYTGSDIQLYLTNNTASGFLRRIPADLRSIIVPTTIKCLRNYSSSIIDNLTNQKFFLPSAYELAGSYSGLWFDEGVRSTYYTSNYSTSDAKRVRYKQSGGSSTYWWTRTPYRGSSNYVIRVDSSGNVYYNYDAIHSRGVAPAFVIA